MNVCIGSSFIYGYLISWRKKWRNAAIENVDGWMGSFSRLAATKTEQTGGKSSRQQSTEKLRWTRIEECCSYMPACFPQSYPARFAPTPLFFSRFLEMLDLGDWRRCTSLNWICFFFLPIAQRRERFRTHGRACFHGENFVESEVSLWPWN